jgi:CheY-like chemotaxis protein
LKILYVEDNDDNVFVIETRLRALDYDVLVATDGPSGIERARAEQPALILMDLSLPVIDGWEAARRLKSDEHTKHIPIIALTSHAMVGEREKAIAAGCDEFETKPVQFARLVQKIEMLVPKA